MNRFLVCMILLSISLLGSVGGHAEKHRYKGKPGGKMIRVLIVDGQNNHDWKKTTPMMKADLEATGLFVVTVATAPASGQNMDAFHPIFSDYDVILLNYNGDRWPKQTEADFIKYVKKGGGVVSVHASDNSFPDWPAFNQMIGLGGWGNRNEKAGPYVYYDSSKGGYVRDTSAGVGGSHGNYYAFPVTIRVKDHPITKGLPAVWMHDKDELYNRLRGPAENMEILATAYSAKNQGGTGRDEPMMMVLRYGKGRIFHTPMGHGVESQKCIGFITILQRGTQWAATGKVTVPIPANFPGPDQVSVEP